MRVLLNCLVFVFAVLSLLFNFIGAIIGIPSFILLLLSDIFEELVKKIEVK